MRKNIFKKAMALVLSLSMVVGVSGVASAATHAANGANIANGKWTSFSVCTREDGGVWEDALKGVEVTDADTGEFLRYQTKGQDYATEGWISERTSSSFSYFVKNTGWDGEYNKYTGELITDNPWGLTATMTDIPVELGRYYTISFKIKSTLKGSVTVKDDNGEAVLDENGNEVKKDVLTKQILFKAYNPTAPGEPGIDYYSTKGISSGGYMTLNYVDADSDEWQEVTATVKIPSTAKEYSGGKMGVKFAMGAFLYNIPDEIAMSGYVYVKDFKVTAGNQYTVKLTDPVSKKTVTQYVNPGEKASSYGFTRKGYTLAGYKNGSSTYNFSSPVNSNLNLTAVWTKTKAPAKAKISKAKAGKKKVTLTLKKVTNAKGYEVSYAKKKNMKGAKKKTTTATKLTIKKLTSRKYTYIRVRAFVYDSAGNKVYGKYSAKKKVYIK